MMRFDPLKPRSLAVGLVLTLMLDCCRMLQSRAGATAVRLRTTRRSDGANRQKASSYSWQFGQNPTTELVKELLNDRNPDEYGIVLEADWRTRFEPLRLWAVSEFVEPMHNMFHADKKSVDWIRNVVLQKTSSEWVYNKLKGEVEQCEPLVLKQLQEFADKTSKQVPLDGQLVWMHKVSPTDVVPSLLKDGKLAKLSDLLAPQFLKLWNRFVSEGIRECSSGGWKYANWYTILDTRLRDFSEPDKKEFWPQFNVNMSRELAGMGNGSSVWYDQPQNFLKKEWENYDNMNRGGLILR